MVGYVHGAVAVVLDGLDLNLASTHDGNSVDREDYGTSKDLASRAKSLEQRTTEAQRKEYTQR